MSEVGRWLEDLATWMPGGVGSRIRSRHWRRRLAECGEGLGVAQGARIRGAENIRFGKGVQLGLLAQIFASGSGDERIVFGDRVLLNSNVFINADMGGVIEVGSDVLIGPNVVFRASDHAFDDRTLTIREQGHVAGRIVVADDVWIGANAVLLPDVEIGRGAIVAAGAVVTKSVDEYTIVGGVPARPIGIRGEEGQG